MAKILCNGLNHYYEQAGEGPSLVFIHGAFGDARLWDPQWEHFSPKYRVLRYDLRGHGKTGTSELDRYTMVTFADDLASIMDALKIDSAIVCGLSWGGGIAQTFAVRYPERVKGLVLASSTVSMSLTLGEKLIRYVLFPRWIMMMTIRMLSAERFVKFSFQLAGLTLGKNWLNKDEHTLELIRGSMLQIESNEYLKIWDTIYSFDLQQLETIRSPTLVLTGERDTKMVLRHANEILKRVSGAEKRVIPAAYHAMTLEQPQAFNRAMEKFLSSLHLTPTRNEGSSTCT
jgi:pimeloyl-ACP methyl ester carboxylesterase